MHISSLNRVAGLAALLIAASASSFAQKMPSKLAPIPTSTSVQTVNDPSFGGMPAIDLAVPTGWKMEGQMFQAPCTFIPSPVFRQYSPDGLLEFRAMPTF